MVISGQTATRLKKMPWLLEDLLGTTEDMGFLWGPLTQALACSHCGHCCLHSPGYLVVLFLFAIWQIQRWQQCESWCSGDMTTVKGLPLLYDFAFFSHLQKRKSKEKEKRKEGQGERAQSSSLDPVKPCCPPKDAPRGDGSSAGPPQPPCGSESLSKAPGTASQTLSQPSGSFGSSPAFQIPTTLPVRNRNAPESRLQHRKSQFFYGPPSQHSESLETIFLGSDSCSPLKLSLSSVFNKPLCLPRYNLLFLRYCSPTQLPTREAHTREDLGGMTPDAQLVRPSSPSPVPPASLRHKPLPVDYHADLSGGEADKPGLTQEREVLWESDDQALHPQPELQGIRASKCLSLSEACSGEVWHPRLHQHNPESSSISPLNPSSPLGVLARFESPLRTMKQNKHPKDSEPAMPAPSASPAFLPELRRVSPIGALSGSEDLGEGETREQKGDRQLSEPLILAPHQATVFVMEPRGSSPPNILAGDEAQWEITGCKKRPQVSEPSVLAPCQPPASLSEPPKVSPTGGRSAPKNFQEDMGYRDTPQVKSAVPALYSPPASSSKFQERNPPADSLGSEPQWGHRGNPGNPHAAELLSLDLNPELYETSPVCVPSGSETPRKGMQSREDLGVSADLVSSSRLASLPSASLRQSQEMGPQRLLSESKALWDTKGQKMHFRLPDSSETTQRTPLVPPVEQHRTNTVGGLPRLETTGKDFEDSRNSKASEPPSVALSPSPVLVLEPPKVRVLSDEATCGNIQRKKSSWVSQLPAPSLLQDLHGATPLVVSDSEPVTGDMEQKENDCVPVSPVEGPSSLANSVTESHINETFGDKPAREGAEPRGKYQAAELSAPSSLSASLPEPHTDLKFLYKNVQQNEVPWVPGLPIGDLLHPVSWPPILDDVLGIEPAQHALQEGEMFAGARAEAPSSQAQAIPVVLTHPEVPTWQWSRELEHKLKKLKQNPAFRSPGPSQPACSFDPLSSTHLDPRRLLPWALQKTHPPNPHLHSSHRHPLNAQLRAPQPVQASPCHHFLSSQVPQPEASHQAEPRSHKEERTKEKVVAQIPSHMLGFHKKAGEKCPEAGKASYTEVPASGKRQNKPLVLSLTKKKESPRKPKATEGSQGKARLGSPTVMGKSHRDQARRPAEASMSTLPCRSQQQARPSQHTALSQPLFKAAGAEEQRRAGLVPGAIKNPQQRVHCKHCPWARMERHLPTASPQAPVTRDL
ncbi:spermatogenesis-associated protein 31G1 [Cavia porcellus]|uniref:spermatogenesis-associated protein 31G1 n=1 Tax=Cavia porcellus TaxID=10141 RepID=UPI002FE3403F